MFDTTTRVKASGPKNAKLAVVGMAPAKDEVKEGVPFVGPSGKRLNAALAAYGLSRQDVYVTNIVEFPIDIGSSIYALPRNILADEVERVKSELLTVRPNCVLLCGNDPLSVFTSSRGIQKWRGSILSSSLTTGQKCVATVHPAWIIRGMFKWDAIFTHVDVKRAVSQAEFPEIRLPQRDSLTGPSFRTALDYIEECHRHPYLAFDIETAYYTHNSPGHIACFGLGYRPDQALCIPFVRGNGSPYWTLEEEAAIWQALARLLQDPKVKKIAQNASFEYVYMWLHRIFPNRPFIDTMLLHHCLYPDFGAAQNEWGLRKKFDEPGHGLAFITSHYTDTPYYKDDGKLWRPELGDHSLWRYNCMDVMVTFEAGMKMMEEAREEDVWSHFQEHYMDSFLHAIRMEWYGTAIDIEKREKVGKELTRRALELQLQIDRVLQYHLNVNSPQQMRALLYQEKGYQTQWKFDKKTGRKAPTADKYALRHLADKHQDQVLMWVQELRGVLDLKGDIVEQELGPDNRMHTHYKTGGTDGTRWSSVRSILGTGTNLQNLPRTGIARTLFVAG